MAGSADTPGDRKTSTHGDDIGAAATWLGGGLVLFTASLGAVGGLTGGIARMFRNNSLPGISVAIGLVLLAVALAVTARLWPLNPLKVTALAVSMVLFVAGTITALDLMVKSSHSRDRPELQVQLISEKESEWVLKVQSSSSGLDADDQLLVLVYGQPKVPRRTGLQSVPLATPTPISPSPGPASPSPSLTPRSPSPTRTVARKLDGDRLFFAQAGPNIEGVASQNIELPIPVDRQYETIVVTAVLGDYPRNCEGVTVNIRDNTELMVPPEVLQENGEPLSRNGTLSCVTIAAPPKATASSSPSSATPTAASPR